MTTTDRRPAVRLRVVRAPEPVDDDLRDRLIDCWQATSNAGGAVGFPWPPVRREDVAAAMGKLVDRVRDGASVLVVAEDDHGVAGWVSLDRNDAALVRHWATVRRLQSHPRARGRGIGTTLMREVTKIARVEGLEQLHLTVRGGMGLEAFYERLGWTVVGRWPRGLRLGEDDYRDEVLMMRPVGTGDT